MALKTTLTLKESLIIGGKKFLSAHLAADTTGYSKNYINELSRLGKVRSLVVGHTSFVEKESLFEYKKFIESARTKEAGIYASSLQFEKTLEENSPPSYFKTICQEADGTEDEAGPSSLVKNLPIAVALISFTLILFSNGAGASLSGERVLNKIGDDVFSVWEKLTTGSHLQDGAFAKKTYQRTSASELAPRNESDRRRAALQIIEENYGAHNFGAYAWSGYEESGEIISAAWWSGVQSAADNLFSNAKILVRGFNKFGEFYLGRIYVGGEILGSTSDGFVRAVHIMTSEYEEAIAVTGRVLFEKSYVYTEWTHKVMGSYIRWNVPSPEEVGAVIASEVKESILEFSHGAAVAKSGTLRLNEVYMTGTHLGLNKGTDIIHYIGESMITLAHLPGEYIYNSFTEYKNEAGESYAAAGEGTLRMLGAVSKYTSDDYIAGVLLSWTERSR